jgi:hypothetical protein
MPPQGGQIHDRGRHARSHRAIRDGFPHSQTPLSAVEIDIFGAFAERPLDLIALRRRLDLHEPAVRDFFDALVAIGLFRHDDAERHSNSGEADHVLYPIEPGYIGGIVEMFNARLNRFWGSLTGDLRTGATRNQAKDGGDLFAVLYTDPGRLGEFLRTVTGQSLPAARALARVCPRETVTTVWDIGTAHDPADDPHKDENKIDPVRKQQP